jgi:hypothetical protein
VLAIAINPLGWLCSGAVVVAVGCVLVIVLGPLVRKAINSAKGP